MKSKALAAISAMLLIAMTASFLSARQKAFDIAENTGIDFTYQGTRMTYHPGYRRIVWQSTFETDEMLPTVPPSVCVGLFGKALRGPFDNNIALYPTRSD